VPRRLDIACDVGGAFVDLFAVDAGAPIVAKVPRRGESLAAMVHAALDAARIVPAEVARLRLSTTLAANALLAGQAAPVALVATAGFCDTPDLGRQSRRDPDEWPAPPPTPPWLAPEAWRIPLRGRIAADGSEADPLVLDDLDAVRALPPGTPVAICLLFAHRNPAHELAAAARIAALRPDLKLSLSHVVDPQPREFERMLATLVDASLKPLAARLLRVEGLPEPWVMRAEGGVAPLAEALSRPLGLVASGPAAGVLAVARAAEGHDAIGLDIGSATTEASFVRAGEAQTARGTWLGGRWLRGATLDVESLPLGGEVAIPGHAATLRDADEATLRHAIAWLAEQVWRQSFHRNLDPARTRLVVGGGAGVHLAPRIAAALGARDLVVPEHAAVLAAAGLAAAPAMAREEAACDHPLDALPALRAMAAAQAATLRARIAGWGLRDATLRHELDLAPGPRAEPIALSWSPDENAATVAARFTEAARQRRGQAPPGAPRVLALRSIVTGALPPP
jgi:N-methylhydantoinase A